MVLYLELDMTILRKKCQELLEQLKKEFMYLGIEKQNYLDILFYDIALQLYLLNYITLY